jgi:hypothetical protein
MSTSSSGHIISRLISRTAGIRGRRHCVQRVDKGEDDKGVSRQFIAASDHFHCQGRPAGMREGKARASDIILDVRPAEIFYRQRTGDRRAKHGLILVSNLSSCDGALAIPGTAEKGQPLITECEMNKSVRRSSGTVLPLASLLLFATEARWARPTQTHFRAEQQIGS